MASKLGTGRKVITKEEKNARDFRKFQEIYMKKKRVLELEVIRANKRQQESTNIIDRVFQENKARAATQERNRKLIKGVKLAAGLEQMENLL